MTTTNQHGGARPAVRPDDGRRSNPGGPGRQPRKVTLQLGDVHCVHVRTPDGRQAGPSLLLEVTKVDRACVELTDRHTGNVYHFAR